MITDKTVQLPAGMTPKTEGRYVKKILALAYPRAEDVYEFLGFSMTDRRRWTAIQKLQAEAIREKISKAKPGELVACDWEAFAWEKTKDMPVPKSRKSKTKTASQKTAASSQSGLERPTFAATPQPEPGVSSEDQPHPALGSEQAAIEVTKPARPTGNRKAGKQKNTISENATGTTAKQPVNTGNQEPASTRQEEPSLAGGTMDAQAPLPATSKPTVTAKVTCSTKEVIGDGDITFPVEYRPYRRGGHGRKSPSPPPPPKRIKVIKSVKEK